MKFYKRTGKLLWWAKFAKMTKINSIATVKDDSVFYGCGDNFENEDYSGVTDFEKDYNYTAGIFRMQNDGKVKWFVKFGGKNPVSTAKS